MTKETKMIIKNQKFLDTLKERNILDGEDLDLLLKTVKQDAYSVMKHIVSEGLMSREEAAKLWADSLGKSMVDLKSTLFQGEVVAKLPREFAKKNCVILIYKFGTQITAAMADPVNPSLTQDVERQCGEMISTVFALREDILDAIELQYNTAEALKESASKLDFMNATTPGQELSAADLKRLAGNEGITAFTRSFMMLAVKEGASDIHIEPFQNFVRIRLRVDGVMTEKMRLAKDVHLALISHIKILGNMDITERRKPLDGRVVLKLEEAAIDFRASTTPTIYGEKMVLRVLGEVIATNIPDIEDLYFSKKIYDQIKKLIKTPNGVFFITGPTGSGKSTSIFSALKYINKPGINITSVEDPVEYRLAGINQIQVNKEIGLNFAVALRAILRQDPDVILIGEIRDLETAKIATEAALTGHLVLATLHTNDAIQAITRLIEIGVEPFIVGPSVIGVMAQRLVRKICNSCKEDYTMPPEEVDRYFIRSGDAKVTLYRGRGCKDCGNTGYRGRMGIHEMVMVNNELRDLLSRNRPLAEVRESAERMGYEPLRYDGFKKALRGFTTIEEVKRITAAAD